ncbi:alcohol dehydrogenase catalytic domain-containing protein [Sphingobium sp. AP49]|uniref:alcohol dehydrogenase catalytic domain-containing protein n=1 Tax=Sphingobium sp. AP49 TaxID=1144307 RepID=UPI00026EE39C|nr:alcohol dehydrogenase catalytic domain-containing protein [Sphingobium sp. AP49]WHO41045.1 alcohol dehydrogenase catalytic domain-containing protein [Sphingobium sp. AP49]
MKAALYPGGGQPIIIADLTDPRPGPHDLLIRVHRCGICGTDLSMTRGGAWDYGKGVQFGHEYAGEVVEAGREVTGFRPGDRVAVMPSVPCSRCEPCQAHGNPVLCTAKPGSAMAGFAEYACIPASVAVRLPATLSLADGALIEPLAISLYGARLGRIGAGDRVLVLGGGTVALYAIYWARRLGAGRIVALSRSARRRDLALAMGADEFVTAGEDEVGLVQEVLGGAPQVVVEAVGAEGVLGNAIRHAGPFCRIVSLGFCTAPDPVIPAIASYKCVSLQFAVGYRMAEFLYIADQMDKGHVDPGAIVSRTIGLSDLPAMLATLRQPNAETKVHVMCGG